MDGCRYVCRYNPPLAHFPCLPKDLARIIPILDVSHYFAGDLDELPRLGAQLRDAFENVGFWYLRGHGVPRSLIDAAFAQCERFHSQKMEQKLAVRINEHNIGYMAMGGSVARSSTVNNNTKPSVNEAFFLRRKRTPDDPDVIANKRFRGLNQWPSGLPGFRETALAYMTTLERVAKWQSGWCGFMPSRSICRRIISTPCSPNRT